MKKEHIAVILVSPENPDNIGATARAIMNMEFRGLRLVNPPGSWRVKAKKMAMSAAGILKEAKVYASQEDSIRDLGFVLGTTRRSGGHRGAFLSFDEAIEKVRRASNHQKVGIVFGRESKGLSNAESALCDHLVTIPTGAAYPSLNLAQAVMVMLFALAWRRNPSGPRVKEKTLNKKEIEVAIRHFEEALRALGYKEGGANLLPRILHTLRGLIKRSGLLAPEAQMIKGLARTIREKVLNS
jgi:TrmH family RNA methyltransferase